MYTKIKTFTDNTASGTQYLFTKADFYLLQSWLLWMSLSHQHNQEVSNLTDISGSSAKLNPSNIVIHKDSVHGTNSRPVGWEGITSVEALTIADHVANTEIHSFENSDSQVSEGSLIAVGWSKPIKIRALIAAPLFELLGYTKSGPAYMPFPTYNMSPYYSVSPNFHNQIDYNQDRLMLYPYRSPSGENAGFLSDDARPSQGGFVGTASAYTSEYWSACGANPPRRSVELRSNRSPHILDGKNRTNSAFSSTTHNFLYVIPPYLFSPLQFNAEFDQVLSSYEGNDLSILTYTPLFIDSKQTSLLDRIQRSNINKSGMLNFRDLMGVYQQDVDKQDLFKSSADHTCWLSKYRPIITQAEDGYNGYGVSLFFSDFQQEINQFLSQINYKLETTESIDDIYYDSPFKVVNVNINVYNNILDDPSLYWFSNDVWNAQFSPQKDTARKTIIESVVSKGFPYCFTKTDYSNVLVEAGGHNVDRYKPNENFYLNIYTNGLAEYKAWFYTNYALIVPEIYDEIDQGKFWSRYDFLNVPHGFDNGTRQVMILKDPDQERQNLLFKENPFSRHRMMGYMIVEGYVTVPYEIYTSSAGVSGLFGGQLKQYDTLVPQMPENWMVAGGISKDVFVPGAGSGEIVTQEPVTRVPVDIPGEQTTVVDPSVTPIVPGDTTLIGGNTGNTDPIAKPPSDTPPMDIYPPDFDNSIITTVGTGTVVTKPVTTTDDTSTVTTDTKIVVDVDTDPNPLTITWGIE